MALNGLGTKVGLREGDCSLVVTVYGKALTGRLFVYILIHRLNAMVHTKYAASWSSTHAWWSGAARTTYHLVAMVYAMKVGRCSLSIIALIYTQESEL
jgi:hypothetical protein